MAAVISAMGGYVPTEKVTNAQVAAWSDWTNVTADLILERTGISERRYADPDAPTSRLAFRAAMDLARRYPGVLDGVTEIIVATSTPDRPQPPTAASLQKHLGLSGVPASDQNAVCAGWLVALRNAAALAETEGAKVLVVGADKYSGIINRGDWKTASLFGDGAGAALVERVADAGWGLRSYVAETHAEFIDFVTVPAGGSEHPIPDSPRDRCFQMQGREVKRYVLERFPRIIQRACVKAGVKISEIAAFICHQGNVRLLEALASGLDVDPARFPLTAPHFGNTGAASLPLTLLAARDAGLFVKGRPMALCAFAGGMSLAAAVYVP